MSPEPPPESRAEPLPPPPRIWTPYERTSTVIGLVLILLALIAALPTLRSLVSGVSIQNLTATGYAVLALLAVGIFVAVGGPQRVRNYALRRRPSSQPTANPDRMTELQILTQRAREVWDTAGRYASGMNYATLNILNQVNATATPPRSPTPEQQRAADRANFIIAGWRAGSAADDALLWEVDRLVGEVRTTDPDTFLSALILLSRFVLGSINVANAFAREVARCEPAAIQSFVREGWTEFREKANLLSDALNLLGEKAKREFGVADLSFYFPSVVGITA